MRKIFFVLAAVIISSQLLAQDSINLKTAKVVEPAVSWFKGDSLPWFKENVLDPVVVTANKFGQKQSQTGKVVTIITKEQLEKSSGKTIAQVLNEQAGVVINGANNSLGSVQTVFTRGASSGRTLILLDGVPVNDPSMINNEYDLNLFSINEVERIEICKGPQSTLYGSDAIAGVINIITVWSDIKKPVNLKVTVGLGNKNTVRNNLQLYGKVGKLTYTTRFAKLNTNGFSSAYDSTGAKDFDKDGYDGNAISAELRYQLLSSLSIKTFIQHSQYKADIDAGVFADEKDYRLNNRNLSSGVGIGFKKGIVTVTGIYQYREMERTYRNDSLFVLPFGTIFELNRYGSRTQYAELFGNISAAKWLKIVTGFDYRWSNMNQQYYSLSGFGPYSSNFNDTSLHQTSFYASAIASVLDKRLNVELGGRMNNHSRYGHNSTYTFNPSFSITKHWRVFGSISSGFKAPSIFQLFDAFSGNKDLQPEKSTSYEIGLQQTYEKIGSRISYFHRDIKNGIDFNYTTFQYFNFIKQEVNGLEFELTAKPTSKLSISANYTLITGEEKTQSRKSFNDTSYNHLLRRPKHAINLNIGYQFCKVFFASISAKTVSSRYDVGGYMQEDVLLDNYMLLNAYAEYKWKSVKFFADLQNITNKKFFDLRGYNSMPFLISGGITLQL